VNRSELASHGTSTAGPTDWRHQAACLEEDPELFFPVGNTGPAIGQIEEAKAVCRRCEVVDTCLGWALDTGQDAGVWGGLSEDERRSLKRRNARVRYEAQRAEPDQAPAPPPQAQEQARAVVPAEDTLYVITTCRDAGKPWREIGQILGTSDGTCREIYAGTRKNVARATEDTARSLVQRASA
jgi:WhiB family redox-sensing transcriptional regulator